MSLPSCKTTHSCKDGGEGGCTQPEGHYGRHLCGRCLAFFTSGEDIRPEWLDDGPASEPAGSPQIEGKHGLDHDSHRPARNAEEEPRMRCEHTAVQLCPSCTSENCPDIVESCACCHNEIDRNIDRCSFCGGPLCSVCKEASEKGGVPCR